MCAGWGVDWCHTNRLVGSPLVIAYSAMELLRKYPRSCNSNAISGVAPATANSRIAQELGEMGPDVCNSFSPIGV